MVRLDHKFIVTDVILEDGITRREFINIAHIQRVYIVDKYVNMELINDVILTLNASNIDTVMEKFYP
jgi:hypothetical protein